MSVAGSACPACSRQTLPRVARALSHLAKHHAGDEVFIREMNPANGTRAERSTEQYVFTVGTYKLLAFTIGTIGAFGFCNNAVVIVLFCRFRRLRTPTNLLLVNISLSDFLVSVVGINFTFASCLKRGWIWSEATCTWDGFSNSLFGKRNKRTRTSVSRIHAPTL